MQRTPSLSNVIASIVRCDGDGDMSTAMWYWVYFCSKRKVKRTCCALHPGLQSYYYRCWLLRVNVFNCTIDRWQTKNIFSLVVFFSSSDSFFLFNSKYVLLQLVAMINTKQKTKYKQLRSMSIKSDRIFLFEFTFYHWHIVTTHKMKWSRRNNALEFVVRLIVNKGKTYQIRHYMLRL